MKATAERWTTLGLILAVGLIAGLSVFNHVSTREFMELTTQRMQARRLVVALKNLFSTLQDAESGQRGYLLTGMETSLAPYVNARSLLPERIRQVNALLPGHPGIADEVEQLLPLIEEKFTELEEGVDARKTGGLDAALKIVRTDRGDAVMNRIRRLISTVEEDVVALLENRAEMAGERERRATAALIAGDVCSIGVLLGIYYVMLRLIRSRRRALQELREANGSLENRVTARTAELRESEERFRTFLDHTPAAAFVKDREGRYLLGNRAWAGQFGKPVQELIGKTDADLWPPEAARAFHASDEAAWKSETPVQTVESGRTPDGALHWWNVFKFQVAVSDQRRLLGGVALDVTQIKEADEEIRKLNAELEQRVNRRTAELQAKNKELETFSYSVSHDLKAPLRGIDGYSRLLLEDYKDKLDEDGRSFIRNIRQGAEQMQQLIEDLLAYSKLERRALYTSRVPLRSLVEDVLGERRHDLEKVLLETRLGDEAVDADREGLALALRNLIDNAAKFSRHQPAPRIEVASRVDHGRCILSVRDNGTGFEMKYHDLIFQIFHRLHRAEDYGGTGIGLAIVRKAMERMGGRVWAESEPGAGAVFYLDLPLNNGKNEAEQRSFQP